MTRTLIAVSILALCTLLSAFAVAMGASYAINERCTDKMAWDGNC
jgi:hypothetical protein